MLLAISSCESLLWRKRLRCVFESLAHNERALSPGSMSTDTGIVDMNIPTVAFSATPLLPRTGVPIVTSRSTFEVRDSYMSAAASNTTDTEECSSRINFLTAADTSPEISVEYLFDLGEYSSSCA